MFLLVLYPPPPILRLNIANFAVAEGWLLLDIGWFVLFLWFTASLRPSSSKFCLLQQQLLFSLLNVRNSLATVLKYKERLLRRCINEGADRVRGRGRWGGGRGRWGGREGEVRGREEGEEGEGGGEEGWEEGEEVAGGGRGEKNGEGGGGRKICARAAPRREEGDKGAGGGGKGREGGDVYPPPVRPLINQFQVHQNAFYREFLEI